MEEYPDIEDNTLVDTLNGNTVLTCSADNRITSFDIVHIIFSVQGSNNTTQTVRESFYSIPCPPPKKLFYTFIF